MRFFVEATDCCWGNSLRGLEDLIERYPCIKKFNPEIIKTRDKKASWHGEDEYTIFVDFDTLEDLAFFAREVGEEIIIRHPEPLEEFGAKFGLEIYNDYRE